MADDKKYGNVWCLARGKRKIENGSEFQRGMKTFYLSNTNSDTLC